MGASESVPEKSIHEFKVKVNELQERILPQTQLSFPLFLSQKVMAKSFFLAFLLWRRIAGIRTWTSVFTEAKSFLWSTLLPDGLSLTLSSDFLFQSWEFYISFPACICGTNVGNSPWFRSPFVNETVDLRTPTIPSSPNFTTNTEKKVSFILFFFP